MAAAGTGRVRRGDRAAETVVYIPPSVKGSVAVSGAAELDTVVVNPDGSRIAYVAPTRNSGYGLTVGGPANVVSRIGERGGSRSVAPDRRGAGSAGGRSHHCAGESVVRPDDRQQRRTRRYLGLSAPRHVGPRSGLSEPHRRRATRPYAMSLKTAVLFSVSSATGKLKPQVGQGSARVFSSADRS